MPSLGRLPLIACAALAPALALATGAPTRSIVASVASAGQEVTSGGAAWRVWGVGDGCDAVSGYPNDGTVGAAKPGYAVGEVGAVVSRPPAAGDLRVFFPR